MNVSFLGSPKKEAIRRYLPAWVEALCAEGRNVILTLSLAELLPDATRQQVQVRSEESLLLQNCDLLVTLGGDGTILYAARLVADRNVPILGVKFGGLGFMADVSPDDFLQAFREVCQGTSEKQQRMVLHGQIHNEENPFALPHYALNDIVVLRQHRSHVSRINVWVDDAQVCTYIADGLIVSTPTGSTAYSMACGGPLLAPLIDCFVITPICPHSLIPRPIVVSGDTTVKVRVGEEWEQDLVVSADGDEIGYLRSTDELLVRKAPHKITLLHRAGYSFFDVLRAKLNWGDDIRQGEDG